MSRPRSPRRAGALAPTAREARRHAGAAIGAAGGATFLGLVAGMIGAVIGTLAGAAFRRRLAAAFGNDRPAAFIEDAVAVVGAFLIL